MFSIYDCKNDVQDSLEIPKHGQIYLVPGQNWNESWSVVWPIFHLQTARRTVGHVVKLLKRMQILRKSRTKVRKWIRVKAHVYRIHTGCDQTVFSMCLLIHNVTFISVFLGATVIAKRAGCSGYLWAAELGRILERGSSRLRTQNLRVSFLNCIYLCVVSLLNELNFRKRGYFPLYCANFPANSQVLP